MGYRIVLIGGGSYTWTPTFAGDLFLREALDGSELVLVDTDMPAAQVMKEYAEKIQSVIGSSWSIKVEDLESALAGADIVCVSISTGGLQAMAHDYDIPEKYGIYHAVGDTVGPGGISRSLRNIPVFVNIARKMTEICPDAWMIHVTNPLSQLTRAVCIETGIKCVGLCHNYEGTMTMLANYLDAKKNEVNAICVGVNHFTWLKNITCNGKSVESELSLEGYINYFSRKNKHLLSNTTDDIIQEELPNRNMEYYLNFYLFERFGYFPVGSSNHVAENFPFYCNNLEIMKKYHIRRKGVLPRRQILKDNRVKKIHDILAGNIPMPETKPSDEGFSSIAESLCTGKVSRCVVAMPNLGQINNLPKQVIVETLAEINGSGIYPLASGDLKDELIGYMLTIINEQEITVKAALTGRRDLVVKAMAISPMVQDKDCVELLTDELLDANRELLPQFFN